MKYGNFVKENIALIGAGDDLTISLLKIEGYSRASYEFAVDEVVKYGIRNGKNWEVGLGVFKADNKFERTTPEATLYNGTFDDSTPSRILISGGAYFFSTVSAADLNAFGAGGETVTADTLDLALIGAPTYTSLQEMHDVLHSTGVVTDHTIVDDADGTITVNAGSGLIRATNSELAKLYFLSWNAESGVNVNLVDDDLNYIYVEYNAGSPQVVATTVKRTDYNTNIFLGNVYRLGTTLHITHENAIHVSNHAANMILRMNDLNPFARVDGAIISEVGTLNLAVTAGNFWQGLEKFTTPAKDTSITDIFSYYYRDGAGGWTEILTQTVINNANYDDGSGVLAALGVAKYGTHWVYVGVDGDFYLVYGRGSYTLSAAEDEGIPSSLPPHFENHARLFGRVIVKNGSSVFTSIESAFDTTFGGTVPTDHGDLVGLSDDDHTQYLLTDGTRAATKFEFIGEIWRTGATLNGTTINGHVNLGSNSSTGLVGQAYDFCTIGGGDGCRAEHLWATVGGGKDGDALAIGSTVGGGRGGIVTATAAYGTIAGGLFNYNNASYSFIGGGNGVNTAGSYATAVCGLTQNANGDYSGILQGRGNTANHTHSQAGGGGALTRANLDWVWGATDTDTASVANNVARLTAAGDWKIDGTVSSPEADTAECLEWADGNPSDENRDGFFVSLFEGKLIKGGTKLKGIISAAPSLISNAAPNNWQGMYLKNKYKKSLKTKYTLIKWVDEWGDEQYVYESQDKTLYDEYPQPTSVNGIISEKTPIGNLKKNSIFTNTINPLFDITQVENYKARPDRKEWGVVGVEGQIVVNTSEPITGWFVDDDSDNPGYAKNGTKYDVIEVIDDFTALVYFEK